jgi:DNA invertase Pin-like site-specific DNA recombinase
MPTAPYPGSTKWPEIRKTAEKG